jgi:hypothetical protein
MFEVHCIPEDDAQFANSVRAVATHLRFAQSRRVPGRVAWEGPLRAAFGYRGAEARVERLTGGSTSVTVYREGTPVRRLHRRSQPCLVPVA